LAEVLVRLEDNPHIRAIFHVHDEVVCEVPEEGAAEVYLKQLQLYFAEERSWTKGLPLKGEGYITKYYLKD
jgi:DNA polymerase